MWKNNTRSIPNTISSRTVNRYFDKMRFGFFKPLGFKLKTVENEGYNNIFQRRDNVLDEFQQRDVSFLKAKMLKVAHLQFTMSIFSDNCCPETFMLYFRIKRARIDLFGKHIHNRVNMFSVGQ